MNELVTLDVDGAVAIVTLNSPEQHNAFDEPMLRSLLNLSIASSATPACAV
jgi:enoyl-CoA hydratase/carnithine racemase